MQTAPENQADMVDFLVSSTAQPTHQQMEITAPCWVSMSLSHNTQSKQQARELAKWSKLQRQLLWDPFWRSDLKRRAPIQNRSLAPKQKQFKFSQRISLIASRALIPCLRTCKNGMFVMKGSEDGTALWRLEEAWCSVGTFKVKRRQMTDGSKLVNGFDALRWNFHLLSCDRC